MLPALEELYFMFYLCEHSFYKAMNLLLRLSDMKAVYKSEREYLRQ